MTQLVNQPTARPTRKMNAVLIAAALVGAARSALTALYPDLDLGPVVTMVQPFVEAAVVWLAGYMTKERAGV